MGHLLQHARLAHFATVHRFGFPVEGQNQTIAFQEFGVTRAFWASLEGGTGPEVHFKVTVRGTNLVLIEGMIGDSWFGVAGCLGVPDPAGAISMSSRLSMNGSTGPLRRRRRRFRPMRTSPPR